MSGFGQDGKEEGGACYCSQTGDALFTRCLFEFDFRIVLTIGGCLLPGVNFTGSSASSLSTTYNSCPPAHPGLQDMFARGGRFPPEKRTPSNVFASEEGHGG